MRKPLQMRRQLAEFKHLIQKIAKHAICQSDVKELEHVKATPGAFRTTLRHQGRFSDAPPTPDFDCQKIVFFAEKQPPPFTVVKIGSRLARDRSATALQSRSGRGAVAGQVPGPREYTVRPSLELS